MHGSRATSQRGFNIIEVMMATAIMAVGFVGIIQAVTISSDSLDSARKRQIALQLVTGEIESLRCGPWDRVTTMPVTGAVSIAPSGAISGDTHQFALSNRTVDAADDNTALATLAPRFTCSFTRTFLRATTGSAADVTFVKVTYTVTWFSNTGRAQRYQQETYLAKGGLHLSHQQS